MLSNYAQQTMVDTLPIAACVFSGTDLTISAANGLMLEAWGKTTEVLGARFEEAVPELFRQGYTKLLKEVLTSGVPYRNPEALIDAAAGDKSKAAYYDLSLKPLRDHEGHVYGVVATAVNVTERVKGMQELERTVKELAASNDELNALNEEYVALNEEIAAGGEELQATNEELYATQAQLEQSLHRLALAEERVRLANEAVGLGIFDLDMPGERVTVSDTLAAIFGLEAGADLRAYRDAFHPDDREVRERAHEQALATGLLFYEARVLRPDGAVRWIRAAGKVINEEGAPVRIMGTVTDITEQQHDKVIRRKLKTLADNSADLMSLLELDGVNSYINEAGKQMLGFESDEEVQNTPIADLHRPEDFEQVSREVLPGVMNDGKWIGTMLVRHLKTGEVFPVLNYTIRIDDPATGKPIGVGAIVRDLRPEMAAKKALADSEQLLRNVTSAAPTALWMADRDGAVTYVNDTWITWTGRSLEDQFGSGWLHNILPEDQEAAATAYTTALKNKKAFQMEFRILDASGKPRWCQATGHPQLDSQGIFSGYVGACVDLTVQKELQQHKDDFISIASHELKTPVTSLKASLQLLDRIKDRRDDPMLPQLIRQSRKSTERVAALIEDLLNVGRLQQKHIDLQKSKFVLSQLINGCASPVAIYSKKQIKVTGDLELVVCADEGRIDQVLSNLLTNAVKYAPEGELISVHISREEGFATVAVTDQGPGIPSHQTGRLFERYYRAVGYDNRVSGLGLGLYICKEIVRWHGGEIGVDSEPGKGSTFWFSLPL